MTSHKSVLLWERWETLEVDAPQDTKSTDPRWEQTDELKGHDGCAFRSNVDGFVLEAQHVNLRILHEKRIKNFLATKFTTRILNNSSKEHTV